MEYKDYYKIMGLTKDASPEDIKRAYRKLARKYHPDVSKEAGAEEKFKELGEAYDVLKDPEKRSKYNQYGQYWKQQQQQEQYGGSRPEQRYQYHQEFDEQEAAGFEEFINSIFRQRQQQQQQSPFYDGGQDIHAKLGITLEDSFLGAEKTIQLNVPSIDQKGRVNYQQRTVKVKIPQGIGDKQQIRLKGQGGQSNGQAGDLYIEINIEPHKWFTLDNKDVYLQLPITPWEAALGSAIEVPTLGGKVKLKIPKNSQTGRQMRLKGRGLPGNPVGDQYITLEIVIPTHNNEKMDKLYQDLANEAASFNPREKIRSAL